MLTAAEELRRYMEKLPDDEFVAFCDNIGYRQTIPSIDFRLTKDGGRGLSEHDVSLGERIGEDGDKLAELRPQATTDICVSAYSDPELFARACNAAGVQTDDARALDYQRISANAVADASKSARVSADAAAASERHAATATRIAEKSNRLSCWSIVVAIGAALIAIIALSK